jgi:hypothetical protein
MSEENREIPTNEPQPIDTSEGWTILTKFGGAAIAVCGGFVAFTILVAPTRVRGATCSAKLKWQETKIPIENSAIGNQTNANSEETSKDATSLGEPSLDHGQHVQ